MIIFNSKDKIQFAKNHRGDVIIKCWDTDSQTAVVLKKDKIQEVINFLENARNEDIVSE